VRRSKALASIANDELQAVLLLVEQYLERALPGALGICVQDYVVAGLGDDGPQVVDDATIGTELAGAFADPLADERDLVRLRRNLD